MNKELELLFSQTKNKYPFLTKENFYRILLLYYGVNYRSQLSFPDAFTRIESIFSAQSLSSLPFLVLLKPNSPFNLIDSGSTGHKVLLYKNKYVDGIYDYHQTSFDLRTKEPFYFFVREINNEIVLKLNPVQLCDFFQISSPDSPCTFCFRDDCISRFANISSKELITLITDEKRLNKSKLKNTDEVTIITGSYRNDREYLDEVSKLVKSIRKFIPGDCRVVVGSHEAKTKNAFISLKKSGVTHFAFAVESFSDIIRGNNMKNRKGAIPIKDVFKNITDAIDVFGEDGIIVRLIAGIGDPLDEVFRNKVKFIRSLGKMKKGPVWNINIFQPYTHLSFKRFEKDPFFSLDYLFGYCSIINEYIPSDRFMRFKISP